MRNISVKQDDVGDTLSAGDFNALNEESENVVLSCNITLDPAGGPDTDKKMLSKAISIYSSGAWSYSDSGTANSFSLTRSGDLETIPSYFDKMIVFFKAGNTNTGACTINVTSLGVKNLQTANGDALAANTIKKNDTVIAVYSSSSDRFELVYPMNQVMYNIENLLLNPQFKYNQRVFAGGALSAGVYGYDMWKASTGGANLSVSGGQVTLTSGGVEQIIESPDLASEIITISVNMISGTLSYDVEGETGSLTGTGRQQNVIAVPSGSTGNITVKLLGTSVVFKDVMLNRGSVAGHFVKRKDQDELNLLRSYYQKSYDLNTAPGTATTNGQKTFADVSITGPGTAHNASVDFSPKMSSDNPVITFYSPNSGASGEIYELSDTPGDRTISGVFSINMNGFSGISTTDAWQTSVAEKAGTFHYVVKNEL